MPDDYAGDSGTTGTVAVGGSATGEIELPHDYDWFAVTLEAGKWYRIDLEGSPTTAGTLTDPYLRGVHDANGNLIHGTLDNDRGVGRNSRLYFEAENAGTHYIAAGAISAEIGTYRVSVAEISDDHSAGTDTTGTVAVGGSATGEIERPHDHDWFAVTLEAGKWYRFDIEGSRTNAGTLLNPWIRSVYDTDGNRQGAWNSHFFYESRDAGTYYIATSAANTGIGSPATGTYRVSVTEVAADDYAADTGTTGTVAVGGSATGEAEHWYDRDWFAVTLEAGKWYRIDLEGSDTNAGTLRNPYLGGVHDADGNLIRGTSRIDGGVRSNSRLFFEAEDAGTYYISAGGAGAGTGTYRVSVAEVADDHSAGTDTTGTVAVGGSATGEIEHRRDEDWFAVTLEAGKLYRIDLEGSSTSAGTLTDPSIRGVYDADGNLIRDTFDANGGVRSNSRVFFEAEDAGTYYIAAGPGFPAFYSGVWTGTYRVSVAEVNADDHPAGTGTTGTVAVGGSATGEIELPHDHDWFSATLEAGKWYRIDLEGSSTNAGTLRDPYLRGVHDANGNLIRGTTDNREGEGSNSRLFFQPENAGTYHIAAGANGDRIGTYRVSVAEVGDDYLAGTGTTGTVAVDGSATGEIEHPNDQDWFAVTLEAGKPYQIDLEGSHTNAGTLRSPYLRGVYDADGNLIGGTTDDDGGVSWNSRLSFEPETSGTYYIAAGASRVPDIFYFDVDGIGTYRVSVAALDDYVAGTGTTGTVAVGGSATGEIEREFDLDWFAVTLEAGKSYRIDVEGSDTNAGTMRDPYMLVYDADGNSIPGTFDDDGGTGFNSRLVFEPERAGTYYIAAGYFAVGDPGTYRVSVAEVANDHPAGSGTTGTVTVGGDDHPAGAGTTGTVAVGGSATGEVERSGDRDWFAVTLEAGKSYWIDLEGSFTNAGTLRNPYLRGVYDADGNLLPGTTDNNGGTGLNSRLFFEAENGGTHYVAAGANGHRTGTYRVSVAEVGDDHPVGTGTTGTVAVGGSITGEIERAADRDWFAVTFEAGKSYRIDLEGSPTDSGTLSDPFVRGVYDTDGNLLPGTTDNNGGTGQNSRLFFEAENAGTHYIAAGANGHRTGTYRVSVAEVGDDHPAGTGTTGTVAVGGSATGEVERPRDRDWFAVTLEAGKEYRIDLEGSPTNAGTLRNPYLRGVHDADGNRIRGTTDNNGGTGHNGRLLFEPENAGTYYISAGANGDRTGTYRVSVVEVGDDHPAGTGTDGTVAVGGSATGEIERAGDRDWFAVTLEAGKKYRIDLEGSPTDAGTLRNPYLRGVHDADGNRIRGTTDNNGGTGQNARLQFEAESAGTYYIAAGANGDRTGTYELSVEEVL